MGISPHPAGELSNPWHGHMSGELPRYGSERGVSSQGVDGCDTQVVHHSVAAKSHANGIQQGGAKGVGLLQGSDLAIGLRGYQHRVQAVGRVVRGDVAQVGCVKTVLLRNLVITPGGEEVLVDHLSPGKGEYSYIPVRPGLNAAVRKGPEGKILLDRRVHYYCG